MSRDRFTLNNPQLIDTSVAPRGFASPVTGRSVTQVFNNIDRNTPLDLTNKADFVREAVPAWTLVGIIVAAAAKRFLR